MVKAKCCFCGAWLFCGQNPKNHDRHFKKNGRKTQLKDCVIEILLLILQRFLPYRARK